MTIPVVVHQHQCPVCERAFVCLIEGCYWLFYRLCGACREKREDIVR